MKTVTVIFALLGGLIIFLLMLPLLNKMSNPQQILDDEQITRQQLRQLEYVNENLEDVKGLLESIAENTRR